MVSDLWLVDFDLFCVFLCFKVCCSWSWWQWKTQLWLRRLLNFRVSMFVKSAVNDSHNNCHRNCTNGIFPQIHLSSSIDRSLHSTEHMPWLLFCVFGGFYVLGKQDKSLWSTSRMPAKKSWSRLFCLKEYFNQYSVNLSTFRWCTHSYNGRDLWGKYM